VPQLYTDTQSLCHLEVWNRPSGSGHEIPNLFRGRLDMEVRARVWATAQKKIKKPTTARSTNAVDQPPEITFI
jgi:hypothetical protein